MCAGYEDQGGGGNKRIRKVEKKHFLLETIFLCMSQLIIGKLQHWFLSNNKKTAHKHTHTQINWLLLYRWNMVENTEISRKNRGIFVCIKGIYNNTYFLAQWINFKSSMEGSSLFPHVIDMNFSRLRILFNESNVHLQFWIRKTAAVGERHIAHVLYAAKGKEI